MRDWLAALVGESLAPIVTVILAAAVVILLALVLIGLAKRVFAGTGGIGSRTRAPRLAILDVTPVDPKRKLVLIRRDEVEHLLLIGGQNDIIVEQGILRGQIPRRPRPDGGVRQEPEIERGGIAERGLTAPTPQRRVPQVQPVAVRQGEAQETTAAPQLQPVVSGPPVRVPEPRQQARPLADAVETQEAASIRSQLRQTPADFSPASPEASVPSVAAANYAEARSFPTRDEAPVPAATPDMLRRREAAPVVRPVAPAVAAQVAPVVAPPVTPRAAPAAPETFKPQPNVTAETATPAPSPRSSEIVEPRVPASGEASQASATANLPARTPIPLPPSAPVAPRPAAQVPIQPRSMATPTLPVAPNAPAVVPPVESPTSTPAKSLWAAAPTITVGPVRQKEESDRNLESSVGADRAMQSGTGPTVDVSSTSTGSSRNAVMLPNLSERGEDDRRDEAPVVTPPPVADARQPLSVKSFATTIQSRRPPFAPPERPVLAGPLERPAVAAPAERSALAEPEERPRNQEAAKDVMSSVERADHDAPDASVPTLEPLTSAGQQTSAPRPLTLEEEMERLLHDFTIDVSERR